MKKSRRIAFHIFSMATGGAERVISNLTHQFAEEGYEVLLATEEYGKNEYEINEKVKRVHVGLTEADEKKGRLTKFFLRIKYLKKFLKEEKPDVIVAFNRKSLYRALMAAYFMKMPVLIAVRLDPVGNYDKALDKILLPILFPRVDGAVFQTEDQKKFFNKWLDKKSKIILNPLNLKIIQGSNSVVEREKTVVQTGRLVDCKNQANLFKAFVEVHKKHPDYQLQLFGGDSGDGTKKILEDIIVQNHAENYIRIMGQSDNVENDLVKASLFVLSSDREGMPNALMEAMALGLPVVATDCPCGGPRTLIQHEKNGLLIPIKDQKALEDGINRLIEDRELAERLGKEARKISQVANGPKIFEEWRNFIEELCEKYEN